MSTRFILIIIVLAQFCCTSLWFAGNAVIQDLATANGLAADKMVIWTVAVQLGFITGTFVMAFLLIADRFSPSKVFLIAGLIGAGMNLCLLIPAQSSMSIALLRFGTGCCLAGVYPVGMKIAADYKKEGLGVALGFLVGALVIGTAFPHLLKDLFAGFSWKYVIIGISTLAILGGLMIFLLVPDGPFRKAQTQFDPSAFLQGFKNKSFRAAAFGYFGHMWELYTFWAMVPIMLTYAYLQNGGIPEHISWYSFLVIAIGGLACILSGYLAGRSSSQKISFLFLLGSLICCLLAPIMFKMDLSIIMIYLLIWGFLVIGDSPQFSTLVAQYSIPENKGSALTIVNGIGFSITILSLFLIDQFRVIVPLEYALLLLAPGPLLGCLAMAKQFFKFAKH